MKGTVFWKVLKMQENVMALKQSPNTAAYFNLASVLFIIKCLWDMKVSWQFHYSSARTQWFAEVKEVERYM